MKKGKFLKNYCNPLNALQSCDKRRSCVATIFASRNIFYRKAVPKFLNFWKGRKKADYNFFKVDTFVGRIIHGDRTISQSFFFWKNFFMDVKVNSFSYKLTLQNLHSEFLGSAYNFFFSSSIYFWKMNFWKNYFRIEGT